MIRQYQRSGGQGDAAGAARPWRPSKRLMVVLGVVAVLCVMPYPHAPGGAFEVLPRDRADVRALTAGEVREVLVQEGQAVKAGQPVARLDDAGARARVAAAEAELLRFQSDLALARRGARQEEIEVARQRVATAQSAANLANTQAERITQAYKGKSVTPQEYDRARGAADVARQQLAEARSALSLVSSPAREERIAALDAEVKRVEAELAYQKQELEYATVRAPIDGRLVSSRLQFARGTYLERGEQLAVVEDTGALLVEIRLPEEDIPHIAVDAKASARPWAYPGRVFEGTVHRIAPAAEDGAYGKVVRVQMALSDPEGRLKTGMTGNAKVRAGWQPAVLVFTRALRRFVLIEVWSWIP